MSQINARNLSNENEDGAPDIVGVSTFSATSYFVPPKGTTAQRPQNPQGGDLRFNTDSASLEYYRGDTIGWEQIEMTSPDLNGAARGVFALGRVGPASSNTLEYINIATIGNSIDFGDLTVARRRFAAASSRTRGLFAGGFQDPADSDVIDYITTASTGNATDFGNLTSSARTIAGLSDATRGVFAGNEVPTQLNVIQYVTIAQTGNAVDFGDTTRVGHQATTCSSSTRGLFAGVFGGSSPLGNDSRIDYITIATTGDATDFGDQTGAYSVRGGGSNSIRGLFAGGSSAPARINVIDYVTIATKGDATDFGDLIIPVSNFCGVPTSSTRAVFAGGYGASPFPKVNVISYVEIMTTGNSKDFGDLTTDAAFGSAGSCSNAHGGL